MAKDIEDMTFDELTLELKRLKENLCDLEDTHAFTFGKTSVHIGAERAQNMQTEFEDECRAYNERIVLVERELEKKRPK